MRLTTVHVRFWQARQPLPAWARRTVLPKLPVAPADIHACINEHAGVKLHGREAGNTLGLLRMVRKRGENLRAYLLTLAAPGSWSSHNLPRRAAFARKWAARMER